MKRTGAYAIMLRKIQKEKTARGDNMRSNICKTCGHAALDGVPDRCPVCNSSKEAFEEKDAIQTRENEGPKEKHVPVIKIVKRCGLVGEGCTDVHAKIGDVLHPMEKEHHIAFVDFYVDKIWVQRVHLTPGCNPAASAHIKAGSGKLTTIELCNIHGYWINEEDI